MAASMADVALGSSAFKLSCPSAVTRIGVLDADAAHVAEGGKPVAAQAILGDARALWIVKDCRHLVAAWFDGHYHARHEIAIQAQRLEAGICRPRAAWRIGRAVAQIVQVVHVEAHQVPDPVREEQRHHAVAYQFGRITAQDPEPDQSVRDSAGGDPLQFQVASAGPDGSDGRGLSAEHDFVEIALGGRVASADRPGAGDVASPAASGLGARVDEQEVAVGKREVMVLVVQHFAVHGDDGIERGRHVARHELGFDRGAHYALTDARADGSKACRVRCGRRLRGLAQTRNACPVVDQSQLDEGIGQRFVHRGQLARTNFPAESTWTVPRRFPHPAKAAWWFPA
jgi:hypothetical protein